MRHTKRLFLSLHNPDNFLYDFQSPIQQQPQKTAAATEQIQATDTNISTRQQLLQHPQNPVKTVHFSLKIIAASSPDTFYPLTSLQNHSLRPLAQAGNSSKQLKRATQTSHSNKLLQPNRTTKPHAVKLVFHRSNIVGLARLLTKNKQTKSNT
ncbi:hypothetical protein [Shewanella algae]|uniref:hypothetical protein n=1 Tax=Shewanella algae TaxID=38313 RepID=UPI001AADDA5E|nr:hypothetical protein [Shewanella algae]MBO2689462.1 hypothetical protein [Shewanella algae]